MKPELQNQNQFSRPACASAAICNVAGFTVQAGSAISRTIMYPEGRIGEITTSISNPPSNPKMRVKATPLSATKFIKLVELMEWDIDAAVAILKCQAWPDFRQVDAVAQDMADELTPTMNNEARHDHLYSVAQWARKRIQ